MPAAVWDASVGDWVGFVEPSAKTTFSSMTWTSWHFLVVATCGWMNREQQHVIDCVREEDRILRKKLGHSRVSLNNSHEVRLATAAVKVGKDLLRQ